MSIRARLRRPVYSRPQWTSALTFDESASPQRPNGRSTGWPNSASRTSAQCRSRTSTSPAAGRCRSTSRRSTTRSSSAGEAASATAQQALRWLYGSSASRSRCSPGSSSTPSPPSRAPSGHTSARRPRRAVAGRRRLGQVTAGLRPSRRERARRPRNRLIAGSSGGRPLAGGRAPTIAWRPT